MSQHHDVSQRPKRICSDHISDCERLFGHSGYVSAFRGSFLSGDRYRNKEEKSVTSKHDQNVGDLEIEGCRDGRVGYLGLDECFRKGKS